MKLFKKIFLLIMVLNITLLPASARPGEALNSVLNRLNLSGQQPVELEDYSVYKVTDSRFVSQPTIFFKTGANGIVLEENFLFDKNTVHEKDVQRAKNDSIPTVSIPHAFYLVGDFSQLPREQFDTKSKAIGAITAPFGATVGTIAGAGKGLFEGTRIGVKTAGSASKALGGDISGKAGAWASQATAVATGAVTGLFAGFTGGAVEGSVRGARIAIEGLSGADRQITGVIPAVSGQVVIGGRIGKELTPEEQKALLDKLSTLEQSRLAGTGLNKDLAKNNSEDLGNNNKLTFDSARDKSGFDTDSNYLSEDAESKNVAGMW